jgi:3-dehydroquinate synthase
LKVLRADSLSRAYDVVVGRGVLADLGALLAARRPLNKAVVCCDENVAPLYLSDAAQSLSTAGFSVSEIVIPAGETQKNLARVEELYGVLYDRGIRRSDTLVALGGGVVGDLFGFCAATYQRGVGFAQVPTTLLAQVDAAIGGKVGVDFRAGKNYIGAFYQPHLVCADVDTLSTLPVREVRSGAAEVAKYGLAFGGAALAGCEEFAAQPMTAARIPESLVSICAQHKLDVVSADEREESGARAVLNLGHTVGHAIEAATQFRRYTHGEAVGLGLRAAVWLSERLYGLSPADAERAQRLLDALELPGDVDGLVPGVIADLTRRDKKAGRDGVEFVLLKALGEPVLGARVPDQLLEEAVSWLTTR